MLDVWATLAKGELKCGNLLSFAVYFDRHVYNSTRNSFQAFVISRRYTAASYLQHVDSQT